MSDQRNRILAIASGKGGVGKTSVSANLAAEFASDGKRVVIADLDPQGTQSIIWQTPASGDVAAVLDGESPADRLYPVPPEQWRTGKRDDGELWLLRGDDSTAPAAIDLYVKQRPTTLLRDALLPLLDQFDLIILDTPPSVHPLAIFTYEAAGLFLVPVGCTIEGIGGLFQQLRNVINSGQPCEVIGIIPNIVPNQTELADGMIADLYEEFGRAVWSPMFDYKYWRQAAYKRVALGVHAPRSKAYREFKFTWRQVNRELKLRGVIE